MSSCTLFRTISSRSLDLCQHTDPWTSLAPNNPNLPANYPAGDDLSASAVLDICKYHLINGSVLYSIDLEPGSQFKTSGGLDISTYQVNGSTFINDAKILKTDLMIANDVM